MTIGLRDVLADFGSLSFEAPVSPEDAAFARGKAEAEAGWAEREATLTAAFETRLEEARAAWTAGEGERLATQLTDAIAALETRIGDQAAAALGPFLSDAARARALDGLAAAVRQLTGSEGTAAIRITGPADLLDALSGRLGPDAPQIEFEPGGDGPEVTVVAGDTRLATAIGTWQSLLEGTADP